MIPNVGLDCGEGTLDRFGVLAVAIVLAGVSMIREKAKSKECHAVSIVTEAISTDGPVTYWLLGVMTFLAAWAIAL